MAARKTPDAEMKRPANQLLLRLSSSDFARIASDLTAVEIDPGAVLYHPGDAVHTVYFPCGTALASLVLSLEEGREKAGELNLYEAARLIEQPYLAITGRHDRLIPWQQTQRQAEEAPNGEFVLYDDGNHVCNNIPYKYRPLAADWLSEQLG